MFKNLSLRAVIFKFSATLKDSTMASVPPEVYVAKLDKAQAPVVNSFWPHRFSGSEKYVAFIMEMNGGWGVFLKSSNKLVAWSLRIQIGIGMLHVIEEHKKKGYGNLVTKVLAKEIAREGIDPLATVLTTNAAGQAVFAKIGFEKSETIFYIESKEKSALHFSRL